MKNWQILNKSKVKSQKSKVETTIKILLANRGLKTKKEIEEFLNPPNPFSLTPKSVGIKNEELKKAVERIKRAVANKESIVVYGDYDADGVCGTAILWETLNKLGAKVMPYIPHRVEEGYGLSYKGIDFVKKEYGASLIITVDHGISALEKVDYGKRRGIEVIITDHHVAPKKLPKAYAVVHTVSLCGAGIAWMLAQALRHSGNPPIGGASRIRSWTSQDDGFNRNNSLELVAIATIADMVPLTGPNRILVKHGLEELNKTKILGLEALIKEAQLEKGKIGVYEVSHILTPRLNAMGRIEHAMDSLRLLCTRDTERARRLARLLDKTNRQRQKLLGETLFHAETAQNQQTAVGRECNKLIFLSHESYSQGIIGLVAGRLVEKFYRPAIVVSYGKEFCKGSARSINGFNIIETIRRAQDLLVDAGGHPMAAGFTVETKNLEVLQKRLSEIAEKELDDDKLTRVLKIDCEVGLEDLNFELHEKLERFKPYGLGNPEPVFASRKVFVQEAKVIGNDGKHLKLTVGQDLSENRHSGERSDSRIGFWTSQNDGKKEASFPAVAFGLGDLFPKLSPEQPVDIAYTLSLNEWNNEQRLELKIKDIKIGN